MSRKPWDIGGFAQSENSFDSELKPLLQEPSLKFLNTDAITVFAVAAILTAICSLSVVIPNNRFMKKMHRDAEELRKKSRRRRRNLASSLL